MIRTATDDSQSQISHSKEGNKAQEHVISYSTATERVAERRQRYAQAKPSSVIVLGYGSNFIYQHGVLCYVHGNLIRILNVHGVSKTEDVIDLKRGLAQEACNWKAYGNVLRSVMDDYECRLVDYQDQTLTCMFYTRSRPQLLVVVDTKKEVREPDEVQKRVRLVRVCKDFYDVQIVHAERHLYCFSKQGRRWCLSVHNLDILQDGCPSHSGEIGVDSLFINMVGRTSIVLKAQEGWIYMLSLVSSTTASIGSSNPVYYQCTRMLLHPNYFCPNYPHAERSRNRIQHVLMRRQVVEEETTEIFEPDIELHEDECTGGLVIVERRPGLFYFQPLSFPETSTTDECHEASKNKPYPRYSPQDPSHSHLYPSDKKEIIVHRKYNLGCSACLDISHRCPHNGDSRRNQKILLRTSSRTRASPLGKDGLLRENALASPIERSAEDQFLEISSSIWPPPDAPKELPHLLNTIFGQSGAINARSDERSVVYSVNPVDMCNPLEIDLRKIVLINFDPCIRYEGMKSMKLYELADTDERVDTKPASERGGYHPRSANSTSRDGGRYEMLSHVIARETDESNRTSALPKGNEKETVDGPATVQDLPGPDEQEEVELPWFRTERAMWVDICQGFEFS